MRSPTFVFAISIVALSLLVGLPKAALADLLGVGYALPNNANYLAAIDPSTGSVNTSNEFTFSSGYWFSGTFASTPTLSYALSGDHHIYTLDIEGTADLTRAVQALAGVGVASDALRLIDPFLISSYTTGTLPLSAVVAALAGPPSIDARGLSADDTSAAIALLKTDNSADVTFTSSNGATLVRYDENFLRSPPRPGATTLTVHTIPIAGLFYAAALVQAPAAGGQRHSFSDPIAVSAEQEAETEQASMSLVPPPVVLVHGLWGDQTSLQNIEDYLKATPPWQGQGEVVAICYSKYLAFDAETDPLTNGHDVCEVTSAKALSNDFQSIEKTLDLANVVGGRVDIVAHSMGGLVVRHYSGLADYKDLHNRNVGAFHEIVTLDAPEAGSGLATYLEPCTVPPARWCGRYSATLRAPPLSVPWLLWEAKCNSSDDVRTCFYKLGMPLAAPKLPLDTGAVYSLVPASESIRKAPNPNIPNVIWRALAASWPETDRPASLLRNVVDTLIKATYTSGEVAPTSTEILGSRLNDVIVRLASQTRFAQPGNADTLSDLAHTKVPYAPVLQALLGGVDHNVENSSAVNRLTACWLVKEGDASCPAGINQIAEQGEASAAPNSKPWTMRFAAQDRLSVGPPGRGAQLGVPFELPLHVATAGLLGISVSDKNGEVPATPITRWRGSTSYIEITPQRLGEVDLMVLARFADGGAAIRTITLDVQPPAEPPTSFHADDLPVLVLTLDSKQPIGMPHAQATYAGIPGKIYVEPRFLTYALLPSRGPAVIALQPNGLIRALRPGEATVEVRFGSVSDRLPVVVQAHQH
jgi:pimeloyl-ACP methyl ester carboxylesterase